MGDGTTGEFHPQPCEDDIPRLRATGRGTAGLTLSTSAEERSRHEHLMAVRAGDLGSVHSWELVTAVDGPGTRMTVFLSGCPLRCQFCHNPDTMFAAKGEPVLADDLITRMSRYRGVFNATKGGVTISGGEPMMQPAFVGRLLRGAKEKGIHTCLDTSGNLGHHASDSMLDDLDLVLLDIKSGIPEIYREVTGQELEPTLAFAKRLTEKNIEVWIRFVCVPGLTDSEENVAEVARIVSEMPNVSRVEVLPFHQMGRDKWENLNMEYRLADAPTPTNEELVRVRSQFAAYGVTTY